MLSYNLGFLMGHLIPFEVPYWSRLQLVCGQVGATPLGNDSFRDPSTLYEGYMIWGMTFYSPPKVGCARNSWIIFTHKFRWWKNCSFQVQFRLVGPLGAFQVRWVPTSSAISTFWRITWFWSALGLCLGSSQDLDTWLVSNPHLSAMNFGHLEGVPEPDP